MPGRVRALFHILGVLPSAVLRASRCRVQQIVRGLDEHVTRGGDLMPQDVVLFSRVTTLLDVGGGDD